MYAFHYLQAASARVQHAPIVAALDISAMTKHALVPNIVANSVFASLILKVASRTLSGPAIFHSWVLGLILWGFAGWKVCCLVFRQCGRSREYIVFNVDIVCAFPQSWLIAVLYFVTGSAVTMVRFAEKQAQSIAEKAGGRRSPANVWGSGFIAAACAVLSNILPARSLRFRVCTPYLIRRLLIERFVS